LPKAFRVRPVGKNLKKEKQGIRHEELLVSCVTHSASVTKKSGEVGKGTIVTGGKPVAKGGERERSRSCRVKRRRGRRKKSHPLKPKGRRKNMPGPQLMKRTALLKSGEKKKGMGGSMGCRSGRGGTMEPTRLSAARRGELHNGKENGQNLKPPKSCMAPGNAEEMEENTAKKVCEGGCR